MPLPAISSNGGPSPTISKCVRTPLAVTKGIVGPRPVFYVQGRLRGEDAIRRAERESEPRTSGRNGLISILLHANERSTRFERHRVVNFRAETRHVQKRALHKVHSLVCRQALRQDPQALRSHAKRFLR